MSQGRLTPVSKQSTPSRTGTKSQGQRRGTSQGEDVLGSRGQDVRGSRMSNRSPVPPISRTPSADRRLLRALTVSPHHDDAGDASPEPEYTRQTPRKATPAHRTPADSRQSVQEASERSPVASRGVTPRDATDRSPTVTPSVRRTATQASQVSRNSVSDVVTVRLPTPANEIKGVCKFYLFQIRSLQESVWLYVFCQSKQVPNRYFN